MNDTLVDDVVVRLVDRLITRHWPANEHIPTERRLTEEFGVSRATLRSAIDRLASWNMLVSRQGSGTVAVPRSHWRVGVFPYLISSLIQSEDWDQLVPLLVDALGMRRGLVMDFVMRAAPSTKGKTLTAARNACEAAWELRHSAELFLPADDHYHTLILQEAGLVATQMLINEIEATYEHVITLFASDFVVPENYLELHYEILDALENGDGERARQGFRDYYTVLDPSLVTALPPALAQAVLRALSSNP